MTIFLPVFTSMRLCCLYIKISAINKTKTSCRPTKCRYYTRSQVKGTLAMPVPISMPCMTQEENSRGNLNFLTTHQSTIKYPIFVSWSSQFLFTILPDLIMSCPSHTFQSEDLIGQFTRNMPTKPSSANKTTIYILQHPSIMKCVKGIIQRISTSPYSRKSGSNYWPNHTAFGKCHNVKCIRNYLQSNLQTCCFG